MNKKSPPFNGLIGGLGLWSEQLVNDGQIPTVPSACASPALQVWQSTWISDVPPSTLIATVLQLDSRTVNKQAPVNEWGIPSGWKDLSESMIEEDLVSTWLRRFFAGNLWGSLGVLLAKENLNHHYMREIWNPSGCRDLSLATFEGDSVTTWLRINFTINQCARSDWHISKDIFDQQRFKEIRCSLCQRNILMSTSKRFDGQHLAKIFCCNQKCLIQYNSSIRQVLKKCVLFYLFP